ATNTASWKPSAPLTYGSTYTATISAAQTGSGASMASSFHWSFTTDPTQPAITSNSPAPGKTGVAVSSNIGATFNELIQAGTITFSVTSTSGSVAGTLSYNSATNTETFKPSAPLAYNTSYTVTVSGATDADGDPMAGPVTWAFTTDKAPPSVSSVTPA